MWSTLRKKPQTTSGQRPNPEPEFTGLSQNPVPLTLVEPCRPTCSGNGYFRILDRGYCALCGSYLGRRAPAGVACGFRELLPTLLSHLYPATTTGSLARWLANCSEAAPYTNSLTPTQLFRFCGGNPFFNASSHISLVPTNTGATKGVYIVPKHEVTATSTAILWLDFDHVQHEYFDNATHAILAAPFRPITSLRGVIFDVNGLNNKEAKQATWLVKNGKFKFLKQDLKPTLCHITIGDQQAWARMSRIKKYIQDPTTYPPADKYQLLMLVASTPELQPTTITPGAPSITHILPSQTPLGAGSSALSSLCLGAIHVPCFCTPNRKINPQDFVIGAIHHQASYWAVVFERSPARDVSWRWIFDPLDNIKTSCNLAWTACVPYVVVKSALSVISATLTQYGIPYSTFESILGVHNLRLHIEDDQSHRTADTAKEAIAMLARTKFHTISIIGDTVKTCVLRDPRNAFAVTYTPNGNCSLDLSECLIGNEGGATTTWYEDNTCYLSLFEEHDRPYVKSRLSLSTTNLGCSGQLVFQMLQELSYSVKITTTPCTGVTHYLFEVANSVYHATPCNAPMLHLAPRYYLTIRSRNDDHEQIPHSLRYSIIGNSIVGTCYLALVEPADRNLLQAMVEKHQVNIGVPVCVLDAALKLLGYSVYALPNNAPFATHRIGGQQRPWCFDQRFASAGHVYEDPRTAPTTAMSLLICKNHANPGSTSLQTILPWSHLGVLLSAAFDTTESPFVNPAHTVHYPGNPDGGCANFQQIEDLSRAHTCGVIDIENNHGRPVFIQPSNPQGILVKGFTTWVPIEYDSASHRRVDQPGNSLQYALRWLFNPAHEQEDISDYTDTDKTIEKAAGCSIDDIKPEDLPTLAAAGSFNLVDSRYHTCISLLDGNCLVITSNPDPSYYILLARRKPKTLLHPVSFYNSANKCQQCADRSALWLEPEDEEITTSVFSYGVTTVIRAINPLTQPRAPSAVCACGSGALLWCERPLCLQCSSNLADTCLCIPLKRHSTCTSWLFRKKQRTMPEMLKKVPNRAPNTFELTAFLAFIFVLSLTLYLTNGLTALIVLSILWVLSSLYLNFHVGFTHLAALIGFVYVCLTPNLTARFHPECDVWSVTCTKYYTGSDTLQDYHSLIATPICGPFGILSFWLNPYPRLTQSTLMTYSMVFDAVLTIALGLTMCGCYQCLFRCIRHCKDKSINVPNDKAFSQPITTNALINLCDSFAKPLGCADSIKVVSGRPGCWKGSTPFVTYKPTQGVPLAAANFKDLDPNVVYKVPNSLADHSALIRIATLTNRTTYLSTEVEEQELPKCLGYPSAWRGVQLPSYMPNLCYSDDVGRVTLDQSTFDLLCRDHFPFLSDIDVINSKFCFADSCGFVPKDVASNGLAYPTNRVSFATASLLGSDGIKMCTAYGYQVGGFDPIVKFASISVYLLLLAITNFVAFTSKCGVNTRDPFCRNPYARPPIALFSGQGDHCDNGFCITINGVYASYIGTLHTIIVSHRHLSALIICLIVIVRRAAWQFGISKTCVFCLLAVAVASHISSTCAILAGALTLLMFVPGVLPPIEAVFICCSCSLFCGGYSALLSITAPIVYLFLAFNPWAATSHGMTGIYVNPNALVNNTRIPCVVTPTTLNALATSANLPFEVVLSKAMNSLPGTFLHSAHTSFVTGKTRIFFPSLSGINYVLESCNRSPTTPSNVGTIIGQQTGTYSAWQHGHKVRILTASHVIAGDSELNFSGALTCSIHSSKFNCIGDYAYVDVAVEGDFPPFKPLAKPHRYVGPAFWNTREGVEPGIFIDTGASTTLAFCYSHPGDSGSAVTSADGTFVGIHTGSNGQGSGLVSFCDGTTSALGLPSLRALSNHFKGPLVPVPTDVSGVILDATSIPSTLAAVLKSGRSTEGCLTFVHLLTLFICSLPYIAHPATPGILLIVLFLNQLCPRSLFDCVIILLQGVLTFFIGNTLLGKYLVLARLLNLVSGYDRTIALGHGAYLLAVSLVDFLSYGTLPTGQLVPNIIWYINPSLAVAIHCALGFCVLCSSNRLLYCIVGICPGSGTAALRNAVLRCFEGKFTAQILRSQLAFGTKKDQISPEKICPEKHQEPAISTESLSETLADTLTEPELSYLASICDYRCIRSALNCAEAQRLALVSKARKLANAWVSSTDQVTRTKTLFAKLSVLSAANPTLEDKEKVSYVSHTKPTTKIVPYQSGQIAIEATRLLNGVWVSSGTYSVTVRPECDATKVRVLISADLSTATVNGKVFSISDNHQSCRTTVAGNVLGLNPNCSQRTASLIFRTLNAAICARHEDDGKKGNYGEDKADMIAEDFYADYEGDDCVETGFYETKAERQARAHDEVCQMIDGDGYHLQSLSNTEKEKVKNMVERLTKLLASTDEEPALNF